MSVLPNAAVFLDRDGTIIRDVGHLYREDQLELLPRVPAAIRLMRDRGLKMVVVTNQSAVARGRLTEVELRRIHDRLVDGLADCGAHLDGIYYCPHHATEGIGLYKVSCDCRKPNPGMIRRACAELEIDPSLSYLVGDQATDMELAERVGACGIWIGDRTSPQYEAMASKVPVVLDLWQAAQWIVTQLNHKARGEETS